MYFHSLQFLVFVLVTWAGYWALRRKPSARVGVLLTASAIFFVMFSLYPILDALTALSPEVKWKGLGHVLLLTATLAGVVAGGRWALRQKAAVRYPVLAVCAAAVLGNLYLGSQTFAILAVSLWRPFLPILVVLWCTTVDWLAVRGIERTTVQRTHKVLLAISVISNLGVLCIFKYADLFMRTSAQFMALFHVVLPEQKISLPLPVGLSFVVFRAISLTVDVYRGDLRGNHRFADHLLYLIFFPHLSLGPITRAEHLLERLRMQPRITPDEGARALYRIAVGLAKKLLLADVLANQLVDRVFENPAIYTSAECVVAAVAYTFQIYCDFSGYSDMAIGIARLFGFSFPENFKKPYLARNLQEFWNGWHISLSTWLRDYLYIPLGGNRTGQFRSMVNVQIVMLLGGLWHGADWRFALWGIIHGVGLALTRVWWMIKGKPKKYTLPGTIFGMLTTFTVVVLTRIFFRAKDIGHAVDMFKQIAERTVGFANVSELAWIALAAAFLSHFIPKDWYERSCGWFVRAPIPARAAFLVLLAIALRQVATLEVRPYIYAQF